MLTNTYLGIVRAAEALDLPGGSTPGRAKLTELTQTVRNWSLIAAVIAIIVAAVLWAWGSQSQNAAQATQGKKGILVAVGAAAVIIAAEALVNWGMGLGEGFDSGGS